MLSSLFHRHVSHPHSALLSPLDFNQLLHQARSLPPLWNATRHACSNQIGDALSSMVGNGMEFEEVRDYGADADLRHLDWKATARTGRPHIRVYREEYGNDLHIAMDGGPTMWFGTHSSLKYTQALRLAALFSFTHSSRVEGSLLAHEITPIEGGVGELGATELLSRLNQETPESSPSLRRKRPKRKSETPGLNDWLRYLLFSLKPGTRLILLSDFIGFNAQSVRLIGELSAQHPIIAVQCYDRAESTLPRLGVARFRDIRHGYFASIDTGNKALRQQYAQQWQALRQNIESTLQNGGGTFLSLDTQTQPVDLFYRGLDKPAPEKTSIESEPLPLISRGTPVTKQSG